MEYVHGGDIYTHKGMTDFSVNLNPFGPGRAVVEAARKSMDQIGNYPDASCRKLKSISFMEVTAYGKKQKREQ